MKKLFFEILLVIIVFTSTYVYADIETEENISDEDILDSIETSAKTEEIPNINARHAIIYDRASGRTLYGKEENEKCKMASTTKIITSLVVIENANLEDIVTISAKSAGTGGSRLGLSKNDKITVENLLYGLMLRSGNDAAVALAEHVGGSIQGFADLMNNKAQELGLSSSHYVTPHGLDSEEHYTTAHDLAVLTDYALKNETFAKIVKTKTYTILLNGYAKSIYNTNELLGNFEGVYGVKTGFTNGANRCLVTACKRGELDIICVVLGCDTKKDRTKDSINLINYAFNNFSIVNIKDIISNDFEEWDLIHKNSFIINKGTSQNLELSIDEEKMPYFSLAVKNSEIEQIDTKISFNTFYEAPLSSNTVIGKITFILNNQEYFSVNIINSNYINKKGILDYLKIIICMYTQNIFT